MNLYTKGVPSELCEHYIHFVARVLLVRKRPYKMNKHYTMKVIDEIQHMLEAGIIFKVKTSKCVSWIVISLKKDSNQITICVNFRCLNAITINDPFPIPFMNTILSCKRVRTQKALKQFKTPSWPNWCLNFKEKRTQE